MQRKFFEGIIKRKNIKPQKSFGEIKQSRSLILDVGSKFYNFSGNVYNYSFYCDCWNVGIGIILLKKLFH